MTSRLQLVAQGVATALAAGFPTASVQRVYDNQVDVSAIPKAADGVLLSVLGKEHTSERISRGDLVELTTVDVALRARVPEASVVNCDPLADLAEDVENYFWTETWPGSAHTLKQPTITLPWSVDEIRTSGVFLAVITLQFESVRSIPTRSGG